MRFRNGPAGAYAVAAAACGLLAGCGGPSYPTAPVSGRVTCDGKPVPGAEVEFQPIDAPAETGRPAGNPGSPSAGRVGEDGRFSLTVVGANAGPGAVVG